MTDIHLQIREELKKDIPDLSFLYSEKVLEYIPDILLELLTKEKESFYEKLKIKNENIVFEIFNDYSDLDYLFGLINHLYNVFSSDQVKKIIEDFEPKYIDFGNEVQFSKRYYEMLKICKKGCNDGTEEEKIISDAIKNFEARGIDLVGVEQEKLKKIQLELSELSRRFSENELQGESLIHYESEDISAFVDLPGDVKLMAEEEAMRQGKKGYIFGSSPSEYIGVMKYCSDKKIRRIFFEERAKIASFGEFDNRGIIMEILNLRHKKAEILGFKNYGELSLYFKMASDIETVEKTMETIQKKAYIKAKKEKNMLEKYFKIGGLDSEDMAYFFRKYKEEKFTLKEDELKQYFEYNSVLEGLFSITKKLYNISVIEKHIFSNLEDDNFLKDTTFYEIYKDEKLISYFIIDPFYREEKRSGAWKNGLREKSKNTIPLIVNVYNIRKNKGKTLLSIGEVETIFHEFGHAMHDMFSESVYADLGGADIEWDFVEVPSQFHEHYCRDKESLSLFAKHHKTAECIPEELIEKLTQVAQIDSGNFVLSQCVYASLDIMLHTKTIGNTIEDMDIQILDKINSISLITKTDAYKMYTSFSHIFDGGYAAGYYGYMRAEIIEQDIWREFKKKGIFNKEISQKFYDTILSQGSKKDANDLFHDFSGRDIDLQGFFKAKGLS